MIIRILLLSLLAMLIGSVWLGYERGPFKDLRLLFPAAARQAVEPLFEIPVLHQYRHGAHIYVGELDVPSTCHRIDAESIVRESYPEQVSINLSVLTDGDSCEQRQTLKRFKVAFQASPEARVSVFLDGKRSTLVITEAASTSSLEALPID
ncbi:hypothetical protein K8Q93_03300 [Candidatus Parcubacteria bacterium]|nr:hypothetical protein [Candidatus Parcubacteria bacterium]